MNNENNTMRNLVEELVSGFVDTGHGDHVSGLLNEMLKVVELTSGGECVDQFESELIRMIDIEEKN